MHVLIRHKVKDFAAWKKGFDSDAPRRKGVLSEESIFMIEGKPNEFFITFKVLDPEKAKAMMSSPELEKLMKDAGVVEKEMWSLKKI